MEDSRHFIREMMMCQKRQTHHRVQKPCGSYCQMISCPAANGISDSSAVPITTLEPFGTNCAIASRIVIRLVIGCVCFVVEWGYSTLRYEMRQEGD